MEPEAFDDLPLIAPVWGIGILLSGLLVRLNVVCGTDLMFFPGLIIRGEVWRLITSIFFMGKLDLPFLGELFFYMGIIKNVEQGLFRGRTSRLLFTGLLLLLCVQVLSIMIPCSGICESLLLGFAFLFSKVYVGLEMKIFGLFSVPVQYCPFLNMIVRLITSESLRASLIGCLAGHCMFFVCYLLPVVIRRPVFRTPMILVRLCGEDG
jgi:Derlin-2/3